MPNLLAIPIGFLAAFYFPVDFLHAQATQVDAFGSAAISLSPLSPSTLVAGVDANCDRMAHTQPVCDGRPEGNDCRSLGPVDCLDKMFQSTRDIGGRWFLAEYDFDSRGFNVLHMMGHSPLPLGFSVWGFIDLEGAEGNTADREDISRHFLEIDLKRKLWRNLGVIAELNDLQGEDNEIGRLGFFWQPDTSRFSPKAGILAGKFRLGFKCFPLQTLSETSQWSFNWNKQFDSILDSRFSAGGFFDLNHSPSRDVIVTEHQLRLRVAEGAHLITEFRLNEFLIDDFGIAPGVQYRF